MAQAAASFLRVPTRQMLPHAQRVRRSGRTGRGAWSCASFILCSKSQMCTVPPCTAPIYANVTLPNATTARDLSPSRPARKSAHRNVASNNLRRLQRINSQDERVSLRVRSRGRYITFR